MRKTLGLAFVVVLALTTAVGAAPLDLKQVAGGNILVGSPGLIVAFTQLGLIDEYQLSVHPVVLGCGLPLFKNLKERVNLALVKTKTFGCGVVTLYYEPANT